MEPGEERCGGLTRASFAEALRLAPGIFAREVERGRQLIMNPIVTGYDASGQPIVVFPEDLARDASGDANRLSPCVGGFESRTGH